MAIHTTESSMREEALLESLYLAKHAIEYKKTDVLTWGKHTTEGCLGYPGAVLLFSIIATLGAVYKKSKIIIEDREYIIKNTADHFYILNHEIFGLQLTKRQIYQSYECFRHRLTHNQVIKAGHILAPGNLHEPAFRSNFDGSVLTINLVPLWVLCDRAVYAYLSSPKYMDEPK